MKTVLTSLRFYLLLAALFSFCKAVNFVDSYARYRMCRHYEMIEDYPTLDLHDFFEEKD